MTKSEPILHLYNLDSDNVMAFSTTRHGGVSKGNYGEFNINPYSGDDIEDVEANKKSLCQLLGIDEDHLLMGHQIHKTEIRQIGKEFFLLSPETKRMILDGIDAIITDIPGTCIGISTADCIPVMLFDYAHKAIAAIHAGWRGTVDRIIGKTFIAMNKAFGCTPSDIKAIIGPGISLKNFEVGQEVYECFAKAAFCMDNISKFINGKWHIDLVECNRLQLVDLGLNDKNIHISGICTYDNIDNFFSARRLGIESGRIYNGIMVKD